MIVPILLPLIVGADHDPARRAAARLRAALGIASASWRCWPWPSRCWSGRDAGRTASASTARQLAGASFGIVLVLDRLSALMLVLTSLLGLAALLYSLARWQRMGPHFHALFQFQLMGLNGAFLTGDLFNLFVFFEVLLAASYGLALHGSGVARVKAGLHYIAINLAASLLFLIGVSMIYGVAGTLNMADLAARIPPCPPDTVPLLEAGAALLGIAFLVKAAMWPLGFWLTADLCAASPPSAAIFSMMSKVGIYAVLRLCCCSSAGGRRFRRLRRHLADPRGRHRDHRPSARSASSPRRTCRGSPAPACSSPPARCSRPIGAPAGRSVTGGALFYLASSALAIGASSC
jgi:multicomponent K+:H+ antiporter subunit D